MSAGTRSNSSSGKTTTSVTEARRFFEITTAMGLLALRPSRGRGRGARSWPGRPPRLDERGSTGSVGHHKHLIRSHQQLDNTLAAIATEKAGILKRGASGNQRRARRRGKRMSIRRVARKQRSALREIDRDFWYDDIPPDSARFHARQPVTSPSGRGAATGEN